MKIFRERKGKIKAVIFDVGGVLALANEEFDKWGHHPIGFHEYLSSRFKLDFDAWFDIIHVPHAMSSEGAMTKNRVLLVLGKRLGVKPETLEKEFVKAYKKYFHRNDELYDFAFELKKAGYIIGILSDQWHVSKESVTRNSDMRRFSPVIFSYDVGMTKPNPKVYKLLLKKLNLKGFECVFIDNRDWNLTPAKRLGIKTVLYKNNKQCIRDLRRLGVSV